MGKKFCHRKYAECSKSGGPVDLVVSVPRQGLVIHASSGLSVVSSTVCPSTSRTTDCHNSSEFLNTIVSFPLSAFKCGKLLTSQHLGARLLKITMPSPWVIGSINLVLDGKKSAALTFWAWLLTCGSAYEVSHKPQHGWNGTNQHKRRTYRRPRH